jgi:hypothetical protein
VLVTAFGKRSKRIRHQALIEFTVGEDLFESVFMISSQLTNDAIIGCQFLRVYGIVIDFHKGTFSYVRGTQLREHLFSSKDEPRYVRRRDQSETENLSLLNNPSRVQGPPTLTVCESNIPTRTVNSCSYPTPHHTVEARSLRDTNKYQGEGVRQVPLNAETHCRSKEGEDSVDNRSLNRGTKGDRFVDEFSCKSYTPSSPRVGYACVNTTRGLNLNAHCSRRNLPHSDPIPLPKSDFSDPRSLRKTDLFSLVEQVDLNVVQKGNCTKSW